jgi:hypothetical protein
MAIQATTQVVYDGAVNCIIKAIGICDGQGSDEANVVKVDVSSLVPNGGRIRIDEIQYDVAYGVVKLAWDAAQPVDIAYLDGFGKFEFKTGLQNAADVEASGNILLSAVGFDLNSTYTIVLKMKKKIV